LFSVRFIRCFVVSIKPSKCLTFINNVPFRNLLYTQAQFVADTGAVYCRYRRSLLQIQAQFVADTDAVWSLFTTCFVIVARPPPDQIPFATQSDSVRRPIRFRSGDDGFS
jgi:hypothetical protein